MLFMEWDSSAGGTKKQRENVRQSTVRVFLLCSRMTLVALKSHMIVGFLIFVRCHCPMILQQLLLTNGFDWPEAGTTTIASLCRIILSCTWWMGLNREGWHREQDWDQTHDITMMYQTNHRGRKHPMLQSVPCSWICGEANFWMYTTFANGMHAVVTNSGMGPHRYLCSSKYDVSEFGTSTECICQI